MAVVVHKFKERERERERETIQSLSKTQFKTIRCANLDMAVVAVHMFLG